MSLTAVDFVEGYRRLCAAFDKPFKQAQADEYERAVRRFDPVEWQAACTLAIKECQRFPEVTVLLAIMYRLKREATPKPSGTAELEGCIACHAVPWYAGFESEGVVLPRLRCRCPPQGAGWHTAAAKAWQETDPRFQEKR